MVNAVSHLFLTKTRNILVFLQLFFSLCFRIYVLLSLPCETILFSKGEMEHLCAPLSLPLLFSFIFFSPCMSVYVSACLFSSLPFREAPPSLPTLSYPGKDESQAVNPAFFVAASLPPSIVRSDSCGHISQLLQSCGPHEIVNYSPSSPPTILLYFFIFSCDMISTKMVRTISVYVDRNTLSFVPQK